MIHVAVLSRGPVGGTTVATWVAACVPPIDGLGNAVHNLSIIVPLSSQPSCMIIRAPLDLDTYPRSKLIRSSCAEWAKRGRGKPVHIDFFALFLSYISQTQLF